MKRLLLLIAVSIVWSGSVLQGIRVCPFGTGGNRVGV